MRKTSIDCIQTQVANKDDREARQKIILSSQKEMGKYRVAILKNTTCYTLFIERVCFIC